MTRARRSISRMTKPRSAREPVIPAFTKTIERMDATHLVVVCGVFCPLELTGYAACNLTFEHGVWQVENML